jgi:hypothetical protein
MINFTPLQATAVLDGLAECVEPMAFVPGGSTLAAGDAKGGTYLWRITK